MNPFNYNIPSFIKESILWTKEKLKFNLENCFDWHEKFQKEELFCSHANPYAFPNWTYLNNTDEVIKSSIYLKNMNARVGVFGHTHRKKSYLIDNKNKKLKKINFNDLKLCDKNETIILNSGSLGQPRGEGLSYLNIELKNKTFKFSYLNNDSVKHNMTQKLKTTTLSTSTKKEILKFWDVCI